MGNYARTALKHRTGKSLFKELAADYGIEIVDVSRRKDMSSRNITYLALVDSDSDVSLPKEKKLTFTFRSDFAVSRTNSVFFEIEHTRENGIKSDGWFFTCMADYIAYFDLANQTAIIMDWNKIRQTIDDGDIGKIKNIVNDGDECITKVCLVTMEELENHHCIVCELKKLQKNVS